MVGLATSLNQPLLIMHQFQPILALHLIAPRRLRHRVTVVPPGVNRPCLVAEIPLRPNKQERERLRGMRAQSRRHRLHIHPRGPWSLGGRSADGQIHGARERHRRGSHLQQRREYRYSQCEMVPRLAATVLSPSRPGRMLSEVTNRFEPQVSKARELTRNGHLPLGRPPTREEGPLESIIMGPWIIFILYKIFIFILYNNNSNITLKLVLYVIL